MSMRKLIFISCLLFLAFAPAQGSADDDAKALFDKGMNYLTGTGFSRNNLQAADYMRKAADLDYAPAQVVLGYFYDMGVVYAREPAQAADWYKKAAENGDRLGQWGLGRLYYAGLGVITDYSEAGKWLQQAADQGDPFGQYLLGMVKLEQDYTQAPEWFRKAAEQGLPQAQRKLGEALKEGRGVARDKFEAYVWLLLSYQAGKKGTGDALRQLEAELGDSAVERAKDQAREMESKVTRSVVAKGCTGWEGEFDIIPDLPPPHLQRFCR